MPRRFLLVAVLSSLLASPACAQTPAENTPVMGEEAARLGREALAAGRWEEALEHYAEVAQRGCINPLEYGESPEWKALEKDWTELLAAAKTAGDIDREIALLEFWVRYFPFFPYSRDDEEAVRGSLEQAERRLGDARRRKFDPHGTDPRFELCRSLRAMLDQGKVDEVLDRISHEVTSEHAKMDVGQCLDTSARALEGRLDRGESPRSDEAHWVQWMAKTCGEVPPSVALRLRWEVEELPPASIAWYLRAERSLRRASGDSDVQAPFLSVRDQIPREYWRVCYLLGVGSARWGSVTWGEETRSGQRMLAGGREAFHVLLADYPDSCAASTARILIIESLVKHNHLALAESFYREWERDHPRSDFLDIGLFYLAGGFSAFESREAALRTEGQFAFLREIESRYPDREAIPFVLLLRAMDAWARDREQEAIPLFERVAVLVPDLKNHHRYFGPKRARSIALGLLEGTYERQGRWEDLLTALRESSFVYEGVWCGNALDAISRDRQHAIVDCLLRLGRKEEAWKALRDCAGSSSVNGVDLEAIDRFLDLSAELGHADAAEALAAEVLQRSSKGPPPRVDYDPEDGVLDALDAAVKMRLFLQQSTPSALYEAYEQSVVEYLKGRDSFCPYVAYGEFNSLDSWRPVRILGRLAETPEGRAEIRSRFGKKVDRVSVAALGVCPEPADIASLIKVLRASVTADPQLADTASMALRHEGRPALLALLDVLGHEGTGSWAEIEKAVSSFPFQDRIEAWKPLLESKDPALKELARSQSEAAVDEKNQE